MPLLFIRHAASVWNAEHRWQGQTDVPLSDGGRGEAERLCARFAAGALTLDALVASDLSRAADTARAVAAGLEAAAGGRAPKLVFHPGLREMNLGAWCGLPHREVLERFRDEVEAFERGEPLRLGGHGETHPEFEARVREALREVLTAHGPEARIGVVTHGGVVRAVLLRLLGLHGRRRPLEGVANTSLTELRADGEGATALRLYNDVEHLAPTEPSPRTVTVEGPDGRTRVAALFALGDAAPLEPPAAGARSRFVPDAPRLVAYGVPASAR